MEIQHDFSLKSYNSFALDIKAKHFVSLKNKAEAKELASLMQKEKSKFFIIGGGTNLLFIQDFDGYIIRFENQEIEILQQNAQHIDIRVAAGRGWDSFVDYCVKNNYAGIENLSLIPGDCGSSAVQNIGAYGVEAKDCILEVHGINLENGNEFSFSQKECRFDYRYSIFKENEYKNFLISHLVYRLKKDFTPNFTYAALSSYFSEKGNNSLSISDIRHAVISIRESKLPDHKEIPNAGSFFKNPVVSKEKYEQLKTAYPDIVAFSLDENSYKLAAAWLIDKAGWKGKQKGNVATHQKQALVIVNNGKANGKEILEFSQDIQEDVMKKFGVQLNREVILI
jgi:UDP-N-acetylmuramate dehydrogenase